MAEGRRGARLRVRAWQPRQCRRGCGARVWRLGWAEVQRGERDDGADGQQRWKEEGARKPKDEEIHAWAATAEQVVGLGGLDL